MSNWSGEYREQVYEGVSILRAQHGPCPVCGHPTGDCAGELPPTKRVIGLGTIPSMRAKQTVLVDKDIIEEVEISHGIKTKIVRAKAGTYVSVDDAVALGIIEEPRNAK